MRARIISLVALITLVSTSFGTLGAVAQTPSGRHCVYRLVPTGASHGRTIQARLKPIGCFDSFADALDRGSRGGTDAPDGLRPQDLTQSLLNEMSTGGRRGSVLIGTEYKAGGYSGDSQNYFAPDTCQGNIWEVSNLPAGQDDQFESGKGFGGCDHNKKFAGPWLAGDSITCTPNCSSYGSLNNNVSSLRWRP